MPTIQKTLRILGFIQQYQREHLVAPTMVEIGKQFGMRSTASVHRHFAIMKSKGLIKRDRYARHVEFLGPRKAV